MKILLYNPNTSEAITEKLYETAKLVVSSETTLIPKTAEKGFPYISTKVEGPNHWHFSSRKTSRNTFTI